MEPVTFLFAGVLALIALIRSPRISAPQLAGPLALHWSGPDEEDEEEQRPETDRAPAAPRALVWAVAAVAALRLIAFLTFHH
jgi:hypothetical protein